jgi:hypothetical protein
VVVEGEDGTKMRVKQVKGARPPAVVKGRAGTKTRNERSEAGEKRGRRTCGVVRAVLLTTLGIKWKGVPAAGARGGAVRTRARARRVSVSHRTYIPTAGAKLWT